jgi:hypothetical protein
MADLQTALRNAHNAGDEEAARRIAGMIKAQNAQMATQEQPVEESSIGDQVIGGLENVASVVSGAVAEPIAGIAGITQSVNPFAEEGAGARAVEATREALTYQPRTEEGQEQQQAIGEALQPVGEAISTAERFLGDNVLEATGSPALATAAYTLPTAALELLGIKGAGRVTGAPKAPTAKQVQKAVVESAPDIKNIKDASRAVYREIDDSGVTIKPDSVDKLINKIQVETRKKGLDPRVTAKAAGALEVMRDSMGKQQAIGEIDTLRNVAQNVASSIDGREKMLGNIMINEIDDYLDNLKSNDLITGGRSKAEVGKKYRAARKLWGRARRAELIQDAIKAGEGRASGAENGIRIELDKLVRNKKTSKYFPKAEKELIRDVVKGNFSQNMSKLVGRFGFSEGRATNVLSALSGVGAGGVVGGGLGAFAVPAIGTVSRNIAQKLTRNRASFLDAVTRAGSNAEEITKAYLKAVPKAKRNIDDLANLLADPSIDLESLQTIADRTVKDAIDIAKGKRAINLAVGAATGASGEQLKQDEEGMQ